MGNYRARRKLSSPVIAVVTALTTLTFGAVMAEAEILNSCTTYCHGMPPRDGARKANLHFNSQSSAFPGNHQAHLKAAPAAGDCSICHAPVAPTNFGHQNGVIAMANSLNGYSSATLRAKYNKGVFFNQTSIPNLTNATCSNVNCHFETTTPVWGSGTFVSPTNCNACHGAPPADGNHPAAAGAGKKHGDYYGTTTGSCIKCHNDHTIEAKPFSHATSAGKRSLVLQFITAPNSGGTYSKTADLVYPAYLPSQTTAANRNGTCSSLYCHSNGNGGLPTTTPAWGSTLATDCSGCHGGAAGAASVIATGKHAAHVNNAAVLGTNFGCVDCHAKTVSNNTTIATIANHVNGLKDYSGARAGGSARYSTTTKVCTNVYCHSNGNRSALVYVNMSGNKTWTGTAALGCNGCHGRTGTTGAPDYANGGTASSSANSHAKHVASAADCEKCHTSTTTSGSAINTGSLLHLNGTVDVTFDAAKAGATATWTQSSAACGNVTCHGGTGSTVTWGGASLNCQDCHGNGATASVADFGATFWNNGTISKFQLTGTGSWADTGHGRPAASGNYAGSANPPANFAGITNYCEWCHDSTINHNVSTNPFRLRSWTDATWGKNGACMICHATGSAGITVGGQLRNASAASKVGAYHYGAKHSTALSGGQYCWDCHDPHGTGTTNQFMIRSKPALVSDATTGAPTTQSSISVVFTLSATPTGTDYAKSAAPFNGICNVCHTTTSHYTTTAGDGHNSGTRCTSCHSHSGDGTTKTSAFTPVGGGVSSGGAACYGCHTAYNVMNSSTSFFHHVLDDPSPDQAPNTGTYPSSQTVLACVSCHTDHNYINTNKGSNLRSAYNAAAGSRNNHDFSTTAPYGLCVSCHSTAQTKSTAQTVAGTTTTVAIDGSATGFQASMHNYTASSFFGTSQFSANCVKCHTDEQTKDKQTSALPDKFGTHYSVQRSLLNPMGATPQAAAGADFCYRCHSKTTDSNPGGGPAKATALKDYFGSKAMTVASEDIFSTMQSGSATSGRHNVSSYKGLHKDTETRADIAATKHVECTDCHNSHLAKSGDHTANSATLAGVLTGASGVGVTTWGANWAGVTTYNPSSTTAALITVTAEYQLCFKCHSGANANVTSWGGTGAAAWTDLALEFNPNNASRHPVGSALATANRLTAAKLKGGWAPGSIMTCSDCHATDSSASKGPHGSAVKWMLAGTNKAWPYTSAAANGTSSGTYFRIATYSTGNGTVNGLFCLNCHTVTASNNWHSQSNITGGEHGGSSTGPAVCVNCHIRVPHGGKISRLLQTTNAPARYKNNGNGATSLFGAWGSSTVNIKGSSFNRSYFKSSCSEHSSGGSGGEAW